MLFILKAISFVLSPIVFIFIILPLYIYRLLIILLAKCFLRKGSEICAPRSNIFSPFLYHMTTMGIIISPFTFRGRLDEAKVFETFEEAARKHKRLRSVPVFFWLYTFWKPIREDKFSVKNHIKTLGLVNGKLETENPPEKTTFEELHQMKKLILSEKFKKGQSPWMIYIVRNVHNPSYEEPVDVLIVKWHHGLADGLSILKIMQGSGEDKLFHSPSTSWTKIPTGLDILYSIGSVFFCLENLFCFKKGYTSSPLSPPAGKLKRYKGFFLAESRGVPLEYIKSLKSKNDVSFHTVLLSAFSHACKQFVERKKEKDGKILKSVQVGSVLPIPGHPDDELVNQWSVAVIPLPVEEPKEGVTQHIHNIMQKQKSQVLKNYKNISLLGRAPFLLHPIVMPQHSLIFSDFPGPLQTVKLWGSEVVDLSFYVNIPPGRIGMFAGCLSYNGKWKFGMVVDGALVASQEEADEFANSVARYIEELETV